MGKSDYQEKVDWLFNQFPVFQKIGNKAYKPTLQNTYSLVNHLQVPIEQMKFIHVAGTNGKGTTCSILASALTESGKKVGLFTSPHIKDFRERIRINGVKIPEQEVVEYIHFFQQISFDFSPSFFEMTWAMALAYFYKEKCDIVVVETGLGGRLDATNIITPELSIITNIGLDHISILGNTRLEIAKEKAGIIKENTPVIIGEGDEEINSVFKEIAKIKNAPISFIEQKKGSTTFEKNKHLAFSVLETILTEKQFYSIKDSAIEHLFVNTGLYGRNQVYKTDPLIIFDVAHNEMAVERLICDIQERFPTKKINVLYGASNDKEVSKIISLFPKEWHYHFTEFQSERSVKVEEFRKLEDINKLNVKYFTDAKEAFMTIQKSLNKEDMLLVFGSFYLLENII